jgi:hypothetical protein
MNDINSREDVIAHRAILANELLNARIDDIRVCCIIHSLSISVQSESTRHRLLATNINASSMQPPSPPGGGSGTQPTTPPLQSIPLPSARTAPGVLFINYNMNLLSRSIHIPPTTNTNKREQFVRLRCQFKQQQQLHKWYI